MVIRSSPDRHVSRLYPNHHEQSNHTSHLRPSQTSWIRNKCFDSLLLRDIPWNRYGQTASATPLDVHTLLWLVHKPVYTQPEVALVPIWQVIGSVLQTDVLQYVCLL